MGFGAEVAKLLTPEKKMEYFVHIEQVMFQSFHHRSAFEASSQ
jgi:hypothetical protein